VDTVPAPVLVVVDGSETADLLRLAARLAGERGTTWIAAHVVTPGAANGPEYDRSRLEEHLLLAHRLGARIVTLLARNAADALHGLARDRGPVRVLVPAARTTRRRGPTGPVEVFVEG
jgi:two-component system sensor histidine kinase KdpD